MYQKNFDKSLKNLTEMIELYQNQSKDIQSFTLKEIELNISEMERAISKMELEIIIEKIPDNKKKLNKIITNNKNLVKQYKREIQDLKYKDQSILNKKNLAYIPTNKNKKTVQLNFLKDENKEDSMNTNININEDEDTALFIDKNNNKEYNYSKYVISDDTNDEISLKKDEGIKRINEHSSDSDNDIISKINNPNDLKLTSKQKKNDEKDKDSENNKYKIYKDNLFKKILRIIFNIIQNLISIFITFCKNVIYKGYKKLEHYLHHRYGQATSRRVMLFLFVLCFIVIYTLFLCIWNSFKIKKIDNLHVVNLIEKNNSNILESKNDTNINLEKENNTLSEGNISKNDTSFNNTLIDNTTSNN
jgi:hypothetical protein